MAVVLTERADTGREKQIRPQAVAERPSGFSAPHGPRHPINRANRLVHGIGLYGALMSALIVPAYLVAVRDRAQRAHGVRRVMFYMMRTYVGSMQPCA